MLHSPPPQWSGYFKWRDFKSYTRFTFLSFNRYSSKGFENRFKRIYELPPKLFRFDFPLYVLDTNWQTEKVHAVGYLKKVSKLNKDLVFAHMAGPFGSGNTVQLITRQLHLCQQLEEMSIHSPISITGTFRLKKMQKTINELQNKIQLKCPPDSTPISRLEIDLQEIICLNNFPDNLRICKDQVFLPESRHLQIRYDDLLRERLVLRSSIARNVRETLHDFHEIETPILFKPTPEGAKEFLVPSRKRGHVYALPQSPQQYKQILMASGIGKYYQFARCFRDEDLRADRQPEFTQVDLEVAFADGEQIMSIVETLIKNIYLGFSDQVPKLAALNGSDQKAVFPRFTYDEVMSRYGTDKPDLRITGQIIRVNEILCKDLSSMITDISDPVIEIFKLRLNSSPRKIQKFVQKFMESPESKPFKLNPDGAPGFAIYDFSKPLTGLQIFGFEGASKLEKIYLNQKRAFYPNDESFSVDKSFLQGDLFVIQARKNRAYSGGSTMLGNLRTALYKAAIVEELIYLDPNHYYLWVVDFPLFTLESDKDQGQGGSSGFSATHHPFTAPKTASDVDLLFSEPLKAKADHFDLVVNGVEIGGGSRRIHVAEMQKFVMKNVLQMSDERIDDFSHLFNALAAGCPPHAGMALGFDRLMAVLTRQDSIKDVIAFPKSSKGDDMMVKSPSLISNTELERYHLTLKNCPLINS